MASLELERKIGYGFGDMASSMFWKIFSYYLPFFYSNIFGLTLIDAGVLVMITRVWDAVSDPMMGIVADRTDTKMGKYRPYLLWFSIPFALCGILLFTTPDFSYAGKLLWAYVTYILMMTVYTGINVPYGAMLGVVTDSSDEKTVFASYRMFFAYGGSFIALAAWEPLCSLFDSTFGMSPATSWQMTMCVIAVACLVLFILCFAMTREVVRTKSVISVGNDFKALLKNKPWWILIGAALCSNLFNTVRGATVVYFFASVIGTGASMWVFGLSVLFYSGLFLSIGEVANMGGVALTVPIAGRLGKKRTFILVNALLIVMSCGFFFLPLTPVGFFVMLLFQIVISVLTGIMSPLVWSMYADVADYSEHRFHSVSTGLIFSSSSMAQKFGGAIGGAAVLWLLGAFGYVADATAQPESAILCLWWLMSFIPAGVSLLAIVVLKFYPLTTKEVARINAELKRQRMSEQTEIQEDIAANLNTLNS
ncbi:MAG: MFS transporter [Muribaculaceae bacterium]|nr:MFS transporter [Muribaculaceae bacterium]